MLKMFSDPIDRHLILCRHLEGPWIMSFISRPPVPAPLSSYTNSLELAVNKYDSGNKLK
jgi:hypothetical protein